MTVSSIRVFYDARTIRPGMTGVGRSTLELLRGLADLAKKQKGDERLSLRALALNSSLSTLRADPDLENVEWLATDLDYEYHPRGDFGLRFQVPRLVKPGEIYHGPAFLIPEGRQPFPRVVTIHDAGVFSRPGDYPWRFNAYMRWRIRRSVRWADRIIVPSRFVAGEVSELFPTCKEKIRVVPEAPTRGGFVGEIRGTGTRTNPREPVPAFPNSRIIGAEDNASSADLVPAQSRFFLSIGTLEPRKNAATALAALEILNQGGAGDPPVNLFHWVWIGGLGHKSREFVERHAASPAAPYFHLLGFQEHEAIADYLCRAVAFVHPARYEGFGLPPLEAMSVGLPVIASDIPALREVCGDSALYFPPGDANALADNLNRLSNDASLRETLKGLGCRRASEFSWERAAANLLAVFRDVCPE